MTVFVLTAYRILNCLADKEPDDAPDLFVGVDPTDVGRGAEPRLPVIFRCNRPVSSWVGVEVVSQPTF